MLPKPKLGKIIIIINLLLEQAPLALVRFIESEKEEIDNVTALTRGEDDGLVNRENFDDDDIFLSMARHPSSATAVIVNTTGISTTIHEPQTTTPITNPNLEAEGSPMQLDSPPMAAFTKNFVSQSPLHKYDDNDDNESIEVEVKDPQSSSFSSYESSEVALDEDDDGDEAHIDGYNQTMEMTNCVGGIIKARPTAIIAKGVASGNANSTNMTMDLTECIKSRGGLVGTSASMISNSAPLYSPSSLDTTMDLTSTIQQATILGPDSPLHVRVPSDDPTSPITFIPRSKTKLTVTSTTLTTKPAGTITQVEVKDDSTMDFTNVIRPADINRPAPGSPSPFLVSVSPFDRLSQSMVEGVISSPVAPPPSDISFIGDMEQPAILDTMTSPLPPRTTSMINKTGTIIGTGFNTSSTTNNTSANATREEPPVDAATMELFNKYIDTSRLRAMTEISPVLSNNVTSIVPPNGPIDTPKKVVATNSTSAVTPFMGPPSSSATESPTVTLILPRASLKDFLLETGLSFIESFSSTSRRDTAGRFRERESLGMKGNDTDGDGNLTLLAKALHAEGGLAIEADTLDEACHQVTAMIETLKREFSKQEEQFNHSPPLPFLEYREPTERLTIISKMKTLKSLARLFAKKAWYEWRTSLHEQLNERLGKNAQMLGGWAQGLNQVNSQLDGYLRNVETVVTTITDEVATLRERLEFLTGAEMDQVRRMESQLKLQQERLGSLDEEIATLGQREAELRDQIELVLRERSEWQARHAQLKQQVETMPDATPWTLDELKASVKLMQGITGWKIVKVSGGTSMAMMTKSNGAITVGELVLLHFRSGVSVGFTLGMEDNGEVGKLEGKMRVQSMAFDVSSAKSRLLRHVSRIVKLVPGLSPKEAILQIGARLDRLVQVDKQLAIVSVQCTVEVADSLMPESTIVPITLRFFSAPRKCKFDLILGVGGSRSDITVLQCVTFYGSIETTTIMERANLAARSSKYHPIRRMVASILELILTSSEE